MRGLPERRLTIERHPCERALHRESALAKRALHVIPPIAKVEEYRAVHGAECGMKESESGGFIYRDDWSNLSGDSAGARHHEAGEVFSHKSKPGRAVEKACDQKPSTGAEGRGIDRHNRRNV